MDELQKAKAYIDNLDFSMIVNKMCKHLGWRKKDAETVCTMYRRYLWLNKKYPHLKPLPPSEEIDEFWHNHILDTKQYRKDCEEIFGEYFDHYPYFGIDQKTNFQDLENAFRNMLELYSKEFNDHIFRVRGLTSTLISFFKNRFKRLPKKVEANA